MKKLLVLMLLIGSMSCDTKNTINQDKNSTSEENKNKGEMVVDGIIQPGAMMKCSGSNEIKNWAFKQKDDKFELAHLEVFWVYNEMTTKKELQIWLDNSKEDEQKEAYYLKFILSGVASPIEPGEFTFSGSESKQVKGYILKGEEVVEELLEGTNGKIVIESYGFSSNVICGTIEFSSLSGTSMKANFNTTLSTF
jgi:hypothetical protein